MARDEYEGSGQGQMPRPDPGVSAPLAAYGPMEDDADYEALFVRDAVQMAHDIELNALAAMALIRSNGQDRNRLRMRGMPEGEQPLNPQEVGRRLQEISDAVKKK